MKKILLAILFLMIAGSAWSDTTILYDNFTDTYMTYLKSHSPNTNLTGDVYHDASDYFQIRADYLQPTSKGAHYTSYIDLGAGVTQTKIQITLEDTYGYSMQFVFKQSDDLSKYLYIQFYINDLQIKNEAGTVVYENTGITLDNSGPIIFDFDTETTPGSVIIKNGATTWATYNMGAYAAYTKIGFNCGTGSGGTQYADDLLVSVNAATPTFTPTASPIVWRKTAQSSLMVDVSAYRLVPYSNGNYSSYTIMQRAASNKLRMLYDTDVASGNTYTASTTDYTLMPAAGWTGTKRHAQGIYLRADAATDTVDAYFQKGAAKYPAWAK